MTPIVDGLRYGFTVNKCGTVKYTCPECNKECSQLVGEDDTEGSLVGMLPHGSCKDAEVLIRVR